MRLLKFRDFFIAFIVASIGLICGSFFDKNVSQTLFVNVNHPEFATFIAAYILIPYYFVLFFSIFALSFSIKSYVPIVWRIIIYIVCALLLVFMGYRIYTQLKELNKYFGVIGNAIHITFFILVCLIPSLLIYLLVVRKKVDKMSLIKVTSIVLIVFTITTSLQLNFKEIWSRPRPIYVFSHINEYKEWWELQPYACLKNSDYVSFPSGHSISGTLTMAIALLYSPLFKKLNNNKSRLYIYYGFFLFALFSGLLRIISGKHFLTDTCFGIMLSLVIFYLTLLIANKIIKKPITKE